MAQELEKIQKNISPVLEKHKIKQASIFGSCARGENQKNSDIDILIDIPDGTTLFDLAGLKIDLENKTNRKVDLITHRSINPELKQYIIQDAIKIYEKE